MHTSITFLGCKASLSRLLRQLHGDSRCSPGAMVLPPVQ
jgi:hypothetical protein